MRMLYVQPASVKPGTDIVPKEFSERKRRKREREGREKEKEERNNREERRLEWLSVGQKMNSFNQRKKLD